MLAGTPTLTPDDARDILIATAEDWGFEGPDVDCGHGHIQAREAMRLAFLSAGTEAPAVPFHEMRAGNIGAGPAVGTVTVHDTTHP